jgi:curli production assembly/transport component CsgF
MRFYPQCLIGLVAAIGLATAASASDLVYTPINPSFGGSPLNTTHLMGLANAQKAKTAPTPRTNGLSSSSVGGTSTTQQNFNLFLSQLQGQLLSALATQVTNAIFGQNAQNSGTITFGNQQVTFVRTLSEIKLTLTDLTTGTTTEIDVPQVVMN